MRWACWAGLWFRSPHARTHAPRRHTDAARTQLRVACAPSAAAAAAAAAAGILLLLLLLLLHPSPLEDPNLQGPHQSTRGLEPHRALVRAPPSARNYGTRSLATASSGADEPRLSERSSSMRCSESRQSQAASKGFERDAICKTEESEAAGAVSTKGREEAQRGMWRWRKGLGWGFCGFPASPGPWATPRQSATPPATKTRRSSATNCRHRPVTPAKSEREVGSAGRRSQGAGGERGGRDRTCLDDQAHQEPLQPTTSKSIGLGILSAPNVNVRLAPVST